MFEQIKSEIGNVPIRIEYTNGRVKCGVIIDYMEQDRMEISNWKFVPFNNLGNYERTENPALIETIDESAVVSIDMMLK